ncbi:MAG: mechanosensitive ion channel family protein [Nannocystaceae bacterium]
MFDMFSDLLEIPWVQALLTLALSIVGAFLLRRLIVRVLAKLAGRTATNLDDIVVAALERPIFYSIILGGIAYSLELLEPSPRITRISSASLQTLAIIVWTGAIIRIGTAVLQTMSYHARPNSVVQARTLPFFVILTKLIVVGTSIYMGMLAWKTDITAWLASAGIVGIAVGFAAKDSLANFFAGIFIIADAPYKLGDFIQFDDGLRGRVTHIGIRSTRILTRDDIEINIPNSIIGNAKIVNETGGPYAKERVAIPVSVAYGSDVDRVREVLLTTPLGITYVCEHPAPIVIFQSFGASGLEFEVLCWIEDPAYQENVISDVNFRIYKALARAGIEIPYSKHDVYIKSFPELEPLAPAPPPKWVASLKEREAEAEAAAEAGSASEREGTVAAPRVGFDVAAGEVEAGPEFPADPRPEARGVSPLSSFFRRPLRRR